MIITRSETSSNRFGKHQNTYEISFISRPFQGVLKFMLLKFNLKKKNRLIHVSVVLSKRIFWKNFTDHAKYMFNNRPKTNNAKYMSGENEIARY